MKFKEKLELRGIEERIDTNNVRRIYCNLEDDYGDNIKFPVKIENLNIKDFKKGDKVNVILEFNTKYGSFNVVEMVKC